MNYRRLGNTGILVSEVSYGTWRTFSHQLDESGVRRMLATARDQGINYFDTADVHGVGLAETYLGNVLPKMAIRQDFVVATKTFFPMGNGVNNRGLSRKHIFDSVNDSLKRLRMDYIDLYYCHRYDEHVPLVETIQAMQDLIRAGKILHWGVSEWTPDQIAEAASKCKANAWIPPAVNQPRYSALFRGPEERLLSVCEHHGLGVAAFSPLAEGVLTGKYLGGSAPQGSRGSMPKLNVFMRDYLEDGETTSRIQRFVELARKAGLAPAQLALAFVLRRREVDTAIVGARTPQQLAENARTAGLRVPVDVLDAVDEVFPARR
ncbi:MAG: aldo/keto reductase [Spirochaetaceae bacterium]